jgi:hypothetical protein
MPSPTAAIPEGWITYTNLEAGFSFAYLPEGALVEDESDHARIDLPIQPGTNLQEKYLEVDVLPLSVEQTCSSPFAAGYDPQAVERETVEVSGENFTRESGAEGAAGSAFEWVAYSTAREQNCISLTFVLHSTNPDNYEVPPAEFDVEAERMIFDQILATFQWTE